MIRQRIDAVALLAACAQFCGWLALMGAIVLVVLVGSVNIVAFRYNGF